MRPWKPAPGPAGLNRSSGEAQGSPPTNGARGCAGVVAIPLGLPVVNASGVIGHAPAACVATEGEPGIEGGPVSGQPYMPRFEKLES